MFNSTPVARPFGVEVRLHGTTLILLAVAALVTLLGGGLGGLAGFAFLAASLLVSVTLHELGHILMARQFGIGTTGVTLYPFGGLASLTREARTPAEELLIALAGPAVNVFLAGLAAIPLAVLGPVDPVMTFLGVNVVLAVFNLLPAYPMDGGRVLRGALWRHAGYVRATRWAARAGQAFAVLFGLVGLFSSPMLLVIAVFIFLQATAELGRLELALRAGLNPNPSQPQPVRPGGGYAYHHPWATESGWRWASPPPPPPPRPAQRVRVVRIVPSSEPGPAQYWRGRRVG